MTRRIAVIAAAAGALVAGCQRGGPANDTAASNGTKSVIGAPAPTPSPTAPPSPRSIMQPSVASPPPIVPPPLMPIEATIGFPGGGATLDDQAKQALQGLAANPVVTSGGPIVLRGSSDSHGSDADNLAMSRRRAEAVARYLESLGVAKERITVVALGEGRPVAPNVKIDGSDDPEGRAKNRRVDISVTPGPQPVATPSPSATPADAAPPVAENQRQSPT
jgi:OOP family OmpA-OmpF porin